MAGEGTPIRRPNPTVPVARKPVKQPAAGEATVDPAVVAESRLTTEGQRRVAPRKGSGISSHEAERTPMGAGVEPTHEEAVARAWLENTAAFRANQVSKLDPSSQAAFKRIEALLCGEVPARPKHAQACQALYGMLAKDWILNQPKNKDEKGLLEALDAVARHAVVDGIDKGALLSSMIREIKDPASVDQTMDFNTCPAGCAQIQLVTEHPAEYVRLVGGLAMPPEGRVMTLGGDLLTRVKMTDQGHREDGRSVSSRLFQSAMMEFGNDDYEYLKTPGGLQKVLTVERRYDYLDDKSYDIKHPENQQTGLYASQMANILTSLTHRPHSAHEMWDWLPKERQDAARRGGDAAVWEAVDVGRATALNWLEGLLRPDQPAPLAMTPSSPRKGSAKEVFVKLEYGSDDSLDSTAPKDRANHYVKVTAIDQDHVWFRNPLGHDDRMDRATFARRMTSTVLPDEALPGAR